MIENEFGEIDIDSELVAGTEFLEGTGESITTLSNGCLCCTVRDDLVEALNRLYERKDKLDHIIIETTGARVGVDVGWRKWMGVGGREGCKRVGKGSGVQSWGGGGCGWGKGVEEGRDAERGGEGCGRERLGGGGGCHNAGGMQ